MRFSQSLRWSFGPFMLLVTIVVFYKTSIRQAIERFNHPDRWPSWPNCPTQVDVNSTFNRVAATTSRPKCPIPADMDDICIHSQANLTNIAAMCGNIELAASDCQDRFYGLIVTTKEFMQMVSEHTLTMVVQGIDIGQDLDKFVQKRSRWVIDLMGGTGYEVLRSFEDKERLDLHNHLDRLQHRCTNFFNGVINPNGFGSNWHTIGLGLALSLFHDMTLYTVEEYNSFIPTTSCNADDLKAAFSMNPPETNFSQWNLSTVNYKSPGEDAPTLMYNKTVILPEYEHKGHFWWRSMLTYYAIRPNAQTRQMIRTSASVATPCMSTHVRHSDKHYEAKLLGLPEYMKQACAYRAKTGVSDIYLMTDDHRVIEETKKYTNFWFHYLDIPRTNKGWEAEEHEGVSIEQQEKNFLIDILSAVQCQHSIVTYSSNVGRLIAEIAYALGNKEPDVVSLDDKWHMKP